MLINIPECIQYYVMYYIIEYSLSNLIFLSHWLSLPLSFSSSSLSLSLSLSLISLTHFSLPHLSLVNSVQYDNSF